jgi:hypothetical protein
MNGLKVITVHSFRFITGCLFRPITICSFRWITPCLLSMYFLNMVCVILLAQASGGLAQRSQGEQYYESGKQAYNAGDLKRATDLFLRSAQLGNAAGEMQMGWQYEFGLGVPRSRRRQQAHHFESCCGSHKHRFASGTNEARKGRCSRSSHSRRGAFEGRRMLL